mmetsp:Transcript_82770/g.250947  ORF Transcript_82770/g.250947 Transcript_82770/m.250947 type:complete len:226 (-) Transcript_82770:223-900(-)
MAKTGTVKKFFEDKGFGFIAPDDGGDDVFIHVKDLVNGDGLSQGDLVTFDTEWDDRKGKYKGANCSVKSSGGGGGGGGGRVGGGGHGRPGSVGRAPPRQRCGGPIWVLLHRQPTRSQRGRRTPGMVRARRRRAAGGPAGAGGAEAGRGDGARAGAGRGGGAAAGARAPLDAGVVLEAEGRRALGLDARGRHGPHPARDPAQGPRGALPAADCGAAGGQEAHRGGA